MLEMLMLLMLFILVLLEKEKGKVLSGMILFTGRILTVFFVLQLFLYCSVLTPYYKEDVLFSLHNLEEPNEDGVSILFYLQKIYPGSFLPYVTFYLG
jgi:hypothetical protein